MTWAWEQELRTGPKFVLVALADHSDGAGVCWPGHELIAEKCGLSRQTVVEHIGLLEAKGLLRAERTRSERGREGKTRYYLRLDVTVGIAGRSRNEQPGSGMPTLASVGISDVPESGFPTPYKEEPKAIEPPPNPQGGNGLFSLSRAEIERWFEARFWPEYPKRVGRAQALTELLRLRPDEALLVAIVAGVNRAKRAQQHAAARGAFFPAWPDAHRWLRKRRWEDHFDVPHETDGVPRCKCGAVGVSSDGRRWWCATCDPARRAT